MQVIAKTIQFPSILSPNTQKWIWYDKFRSNSLKEEFFVCDGTHFFIGGTNLNENDENKDDMIINDSKKTKSNFEISIDVEFTQPLFSEILKLSVYQNWKANERKHLPILSAFFHRQLCRFVLMSFDNQETRQFKSICLNSIPIEREENEFLESSIIQNENENENLVLSVTGNSNVLNFWIWKKETNINGKQTNITSNLFKPRDREFRWISSQGDSILAITILPCSYFIFKSLKIDSIVVLLVKTSQERHILEILGFSFHSQKNQANSSKRVVRISSIDIEKASVVEFQPQQNHAKINPKLIAHSFSESLHTIIIQYPTLVSSVTFSFATNNNNNNEIRTKIIPPLHPTTNLNYLVKFKKKLRKERQTY